MTRSLFFLPFVALVLFAGAALLTMRPRVSTPAGPPEAAARADTTDFTRYVWPTDAGRKVTSTFGEFRRTHFHGGIDIGTGSTTGFRVFAMREGYVSRIRVSPTGYGKMLYVRHPDGFTTTYAHLDRFAPAIEERVRAEQLRRGVYAVQIDCAAPDLPVAQGELIAYTGETGSGTPHLHFELRDPHDEFVNPLPAEALRFDDTIPPHARRIAVRPLDATSLVDGGWDARVFDLHRSRPGRYVLRQAVRITGRAGIAVDARDRSNASGFRHGVFGYDLFIDDSLLHRHRFHRAPNATSQQIMLYYDWELLARGRGRFEKLYAAGQHDLPFYPPASVASGVIAGDVLRPGPHDLRIVVVDFNGNASEILGTIIANHPPSFGLERKTAEYTITVPPDEDVSRILVTMHRSGRRAAKVRTLYPASLSRARGFTLPFPEAGVDLVEVVAENAAGIRSTPRFLSFDAPPGPPASLSIAPAFEPDGVRLLLSTDGDFTGVPSVVVYEGDHRRELAAAPLASDRYAALLHPRLSHGGLRRVIAQASVNGREVSANAEFELYPLPAGDSGSVDLDGGNLRITYGPRSLYRTEFLRLTRDSASDGLTWSFSPGHIVLREGVIVTARLPRSGAPVGLFSAGMSRGFELIASGEDGTGTLTGRITRALGTVAFLADETPPWISRLRITGTAGGRPLIRFRYGDNLAGVDYQEFRVYIDGQIVIPEIDGEHRRATHRVTTPLARGTHHLLISISDRLGNTGELKRSFTIR